MRHSCSVRAPMNGAWPGWKAISPSSLTRHTTMSDSPDQRMRSGETSSTCIGMTADLALVLAAQALRLGREVFDAADVEERLLGEVVVLAVEQVLERLDRFGHRHVGAGDLGERLAGVHGLAEELLDLAGPAHEHLVFLGELV